MRLLVIGFDPAVLDPSTASTARQKAYYEGIQTDILVLNQGRAQEVALGNGIRAIGVGGRGWMVYARAAWWLLRRRFFGRYDLVTVQEPIVCGLLAKIFCSARRLQVQDHNAFFARPHVGVIAHVMREWAGSVVRSADRVRTVSLRGKNALVAIGVAQNSVDVLPIIPDLEKFLQLSENTKDLQRILCIARLSKEKGIDVLLDAFAQITKERPIASLTIVGDGPERVSLEARAKELGITERVTFAGAQKDVVPFLRDADVYVQPSHFEGWGMAVVEAAAAGIPIVMTDVGCAGELIQDGISGVVVSTRDARALVAGIERVFGDHAFAQRIASAARASVSALPGAEQRTHEIRTSLEKTVAAHRDSDDEHRGRIFLVAFALRVAMLLILVCTLGPKGLMLPDSNHYVPLAEHLLAGHGFTIAGEAFTYRTIGYPLFVAIALGIFHSLIWVSLLQCLISACAPLLIMSIARQLGFSPKTRRLTGWFAACEPHLVYYTVPILTEGIFIIPFLGMVYAAIRFVRTTRMSWAIVAGVLFGMTLLIKPLMQAYPMFVLLLLLIALLARSGAFKKYVYGAVLFVISGAIVASPWAYHNYRAIGSWSLSTQGAYAMAGYLVPSIVSARDHISYQDAEAKVREDLESRYGKLSLEGKSLSKEYTAYTMNALRENSLIFLRIAAAGQVSYWTSHNYAYVPHFYGLTPPLDKSVLPPTHYLVQGRFGDFAKGFWTIFRQPFYAVGALGRLLWAIVTVLMIVGIVKALRRGEVRAAHLVIASVFVYSSAITLVNGLGVEGRLRYHLMPLILMYAIYAITRPHTAR